MCEIAWLPKLLVWSFVVVALALALVSRKLNDHLLTPPEEYAGPFAVFYRRKYHVRFSHLRDPRRHFDQAGQRWVRLFIRMVALAVALFVALGVAVQACGWKFGV